MLLELIELAMVEVEQVLVIKDLHHLNSMHAVFNPN